MSSPESSSSIPHMSQAEKPRRDHTSVVGEMYKNNVQADFQVAAREAGLGTGENPYPELTFHTRDQETGADICVEEPGILVNLPYNGMISEIGVVSDKGVLSIVRTHRDAPSELYIANEAPLHLYAHEAVQGAVKDAIRHAANPELATEEY